MLSWFELMRASPAGSMDSFLEFDLEVDLVTLKGGFDDFEGLGGVLAPHEPSLSTCSFLISLNPLIGFDGPQ